MTDALAIPPNVWPRLGQMGRFPFEGFAQRSILVEQAQGVLTLRRSAPLAGPASVANCDERLPPPLARLCATDD